MSKLLDKLSPPSTKSELDLFTVPPTQVAVRRNFWDEVHLKNPCTNEGPFEFHLTPDIYMIDLSKNYILLRLQIVKGDGTDCQATEAQNVWNGDLVAPVNLLGKTFFKQVKIFLNGKLISDSGDNYAYRSFIETELNYGSSAKESQLQAALYYKDVQPIDSLQNAGWISRLKRTKNSTEFEIMAPIHADLFLQERYLLNQCDLRICLYRNSDAFCLQSYAANQNYKIMVKNMSLFMKKVEVVDGINTAIETMLRTASAKYPIRRTQVTTLHITENRRSTPLNSLFSGALPRRLVVGLVDAEAARGHMAKSPFNFQHFNVTEIKVSSGTNIVPSTPYKLNFADGDNYMRAFVQMFEGLGTGSDDRGNMISLNDFKTGSALFVFDLGSDGADATHWELVREGSTSLEVVFNNQVPQGGIDCIVYAEFDGLLMIDGMRQAYMDYSV